MTGEPAERDGLAHGWGPVAVQLHRVRTCAEIDRGTRAVVDLDRFVERRTFDVLRHEEFGRRRRRGGLGHQRHWSHDQRRHQGRTEAKPHSSVAHHVIPPMEISSIGES